jgi:hypothetical protein
LDFWPFIGKNLPATTSNRVLGFLALLIARYIFASESKTVSTEIIEAQQLKILQIPRGPVPVINLTNSRILKSSFIKENS